MALGGGGDAGPGATLLLLNTSVLQIPSTQRYCWIDHRSFTPRRAGFVPCRSSSVARKRVRNSQVEVAGTVGGQVVGVSAVVCVRWTRR